MLDLVVTVAALVLVVMLTLAHPLLALAGIVAYVWWILRRQMQRERGRAAARGPTP